MCLKGLGFPLFTDDLNQLMEIVNTQFRGTQRGYSSRPLNIALLNVF